MKILIRDESLTGKVAHEFELELETPILTVRELIRKRVYEEVNVFNSNRSERYMGLIQLRAEELLLNPSGSQLRRKDAEKQAEIALKAFDKNGFLLLVDNKQYSDPEEEVSLNPDSTVSFVKLTPLVGG
jgi:hypothetical protein